MGTRAVSPRPRVVVIDDHAGFRATARRLLEADGFVVVGEAADGPTGIRVVRAVRPDLVLVDVGLPLLDGFEVADELLGEGGPAPEVRIIMISSRDGTAFDEALSTRPALTFIAKDALGAGRLRSIVAEPA